MDSFLKQLIRNRRFQDFMGVARGLDRVKLGLFETRSTFKSRVRVYRGEKDDLDIFNDSIKDDFMETLDPNTNFGEEGFGRDEPIHQDRNLNNERITVSTLSQEKSRLEPYVIGSTRQDINTTQSPIIGKATIHVTAPKEGPHIFVKPPQPGRLRDEGVVKQPAHKHEGQFEQPPKISVGVVEPVNKAPFESIKPINKASFEPIKPVIQEPIEPVRPVINESTKQEDTDRVKINVSSGSFEGRSNPEAKGNNIKDENLDAVRSGSEYRTTEDMMKELGREKRVGRENVVPSSSFSRASGIFGLGASLASSIASNSIKNIFSTERVSSKDVLLNEENAQRIGDFLCRMRGAPMKLGQALSMQEDAVIPKPIRIALERAQRSADVMPLAQLTKMLDSELGQGWEDKYSYFDKSPMAAASIGQVHFASTKKGMDVAVKVQYPGVAESIDSDLNNIKRLMKYTNIFPRQLFLDEIIKNARLELKEECDYIREADKQLVFRDMIKNETNYYVPKIDRELSTSRVLTIEYIKGLSMDQIESKDQKTRDRVGELMFKIILKMLFTYRYMQTDPNPANFFYDEKKDVINLIDFGAAREYSKEFVQTYLDLVYGASVKDKEIVWECSKKLGFVTGEENREMKEAHTMAVITVGEPFASQELYDFGNQDLTNRIYKYMPIMFKNRLKAPPSEVYTLHRILSGAYLISMKLKSKVPVGKIFDEIYRDAIKIK